MNTPSFVPFAFLAAICSGIFFGGRKRVMRFGMMGVALISGMATGSLQAQSVGSEFVWSLAEKGLTSAGIYDGEGHLTRVLWTMKELPAGEYHSHWDGLTDQGKAAAAGDYTWTVVTNRSTYTTRGTFGNTGEPANSFGHVPFFIEGVAVDGADNIYTVHDWNEAGHDVNRWSPTTGQVTLHTGHVISEALLKGIAVEPDGSYAYVTGYGEADIEERDRIKFSIFRIRLGQEPQAAVEDFTQAGRKIVVHDGGAQYPDGASEANIDLLRVPLVSVALRGNSIYITDALAGRVLQFDKVTGVLQREIGGIPLACGLAVAPDGKIWVGHEHSKISVYSPDGVRLGTPVTDLAEVRALSLQGDRLAVADRSGRVLVYDKSGTSLSLAAVFGNPARPGDNASNRMFQVNGMAMDSEGNIIISDRMGAGSRLQKITPAFGQAWRQLGLEFSSQAAYGRDNPDLLISSYRNIYEIDRATGEWQFLGPGGTDTPGSYFGNFESTHFGPPRVVRFGEEDFFYYPAGDSVAVYRLMSAVDSNHGPTLKLVSVLGGSMPSPDGVHRAEWWRDENKYLWSWNDKDGDGQIQFTSVSQPGEVTLDASPNQPAGWKWDKASFGVDDSGWLWLASYARLMPPGPFEAKAIYAVPPAGLNARGNPIYRWANAVKVMDEETGRQALGMEPGQEFNWMMVNRSDDGMVYSLAYGAKPELPQNGARWMGGNVLFGFESHTNSEPKPLGAPKWQVVLPERSVGMTPISGGPGGVFVGIRPATRATIGHYTRDGLLVGAFQADAAFGDDNPPNLASGALDAFLALNCNRDPRDGILDVFAEDNWNQRLLWYRVDDSRMETQSGSFTATSGDEAAHPLVVNSGIGDGRYPAGTVVHIAAVTPPPGQMFVAWTGDTEGLVDPHSASTTLTMPSNPVSLTATYTWATGADRVRFYARDGDQHRLLNGIFEGSNGDPVTGPYEPFYIVESIPEPGWTTINVDTGTYRYLRYRAPNDNGLIAEIEFYRDGAQLAGAGFGTPGSWGNEAGRGFEAALDGNTETFFNGPALKNVFVGIDAMGSTPEAKSLTINHGSGSGVYEPGTVVTVQADPSPEGIPFANWIGDIEILANPFSATTTAMMTSLEVEITATYQPVKTLVFERLLSRKSYGRTNELDVELFGPGASSNVEGRAAEQGEHLLLFEFDHSLESGTVIVTKGRGTVASMVLEGRVARVSLSKVGRKSSVELLLSGFVGDDGSHMPDRPVAVRFLLGDANRDGSVNTLDTEETDAAMGTTFGRPGYNPLVDFDTNRKINGNDMSRLQSNLGVVLEP